MPETAGETNPSAGYPDDLNTDLDTNLRLFEGGRVVDRFDHNRKDKTGREVIAASRSDAYDKIENRVDGPPEKIQVVGSNSATPQNLRTVILRGHGRPSDLADESNDVLEAVAVAIERYDSDLYEGDLEEVAKEVRAFKTEPSSSDGTEQTDCNTAEQEEDK